MLYKRYANVLCLLGNHYNYKPDLSQTSVTISLKMKECICYFEVADTPFHIQGAIYVNTCRVYSICDFYCLYSRMITKHKML